MRFGKLISLLLTTTYTSSFYLKRFQNQLGHFRRGMMSGQVTSGDGGAVKVKKERKRKVVEGGDGTGDLDEKEKPVKAKKEKKPKGEDGSGDQLEEKEKPVKPVKEKKPKGEDGSGELEEKEKPVKVKKEVDPAKTTARDPTPSLFVPTEGQKTLKFAVWNVAGLRAHLKTPESRAKLLSEISLLDADILCLQEHKLQTSHVPEHLNLLEGYTGFWICSETTKGYSGVATLVRNSAISISAELTTTRPELGVSSLTGGVTAEPSKKQQKVLSSFFAPASVAAAGTSTSSSSSSSSTSTSTPTPTSTLLGVEYDISSDARFSGEGRAITLELDSFFLVNVYVPNAGQGLKRIDYRIDEWDPALREYLSSLRAKGKPVILAGDLNVAHNDIDVYNAGMKHLVKQPGCTQRERESLSKLLTEARFVDAFRHFFPTASGQYTFFSGMNVVARPQNNGLRLDYFMCSDDLLAPPSTTTGPRVVDTQIRQDIHAGSCDHCPVTLTMVI